MTADSESAAGGATVDWKALEIYTGGDDSIAVEIYQQFVESALTDGAALVTAVTSGSKESAVHFSHRIKGASRMTGCNALADIAERMEHAGRDGQWEGVTDAMPELQSRLDATIAELQAFLAKAA